MNKNKERLTRFRIQGNEVPYLKTLFFVSLQSTVLPLGVIQAFPWTRPLTRCRGLVAHAVLGHPPLEPVGDAARRLLALPLAARVERDDVVVPVGQAGHLWVRGRVTTWSPRLDARGRGFSQEFPHKNRIALRMLSLSVIVMSARLMTNCFLEVE